MEGMEPDVKDFLVRIVNSLAMAMLWLLINMTIGIYFQFAFFEDKPLLGNYIFYAWFLLSLALLLFYFRKKWKERLKK
jgi:hypothetical protein